MWTRRWDKGHTIYNTYVKTHTHRPTHTNICSFSTHAHFVSVTVGLYCDIKKDTVHIWGVSDEQYIWLVAETQSMRVSLQWVMTAWNCPTRGNNQKFSEFVTKNYHLNCNLLLFTGWKQSSRTWGGLSWVIQQRQVLQHLGLSHENTKGNHETGLLSIWDP